MSAAANAAEARPAHELAMQAYCQLERIEHLLEGIADALESAHSAIEQSSATPLERERVNAATNRADVFGMIAADQAKAAKAHLEAIEIAAMKREAA